MPIHGLQTLSDGALSSLQAGCLLWSSSWGQGMLQTVLPMRLLTLFSSFSMALSVECSSAPRHSSVCVTPALQQLPRLPGMASHHLQHPEQVCGMTDLLRK